MSRQPLVSIIMPTYNHAAYVAQGVECVLAQTFTDWELVVIDDGSSDRTAEIVGGYGDGRIRCSVQEHRGVWRLAETYNQGLGLARGELIAVLEGDDFWPTDKLAKQVPYFLDDGDLVLAYGICGVTNAAGQLHHYGRLPQERRIRDDEPRGSALEAFLRPSNICYAQTVMLRKAVLARVGGFIQPPYLPLVDYPTWLRLALEGRFKGIGAVLGFWRRHPESLAFRYARQTSEGFVRCADEFIAEHGQGIARLLPGFDRQKVGRMHEAYLEAVVRWELLWRGKFYLEIGDFDKAREAFGKMFAQRASVSHMLIGGVGLASASLRINLLEWFVEMGRRVRA